MMPGGEEKDSSLGVQTPEGIEFILFPAGFPIRACAWGIDCIIKGTVVFCLVLTAGIMEQVLGIWFYLIANFILDWFYHMGFEVFGNGRTPGKRIMGIQVVKNDGSPVDPGASFLRNILRFADGFLYLYLAGFLSMAASPGFRRFGDWAGGTLVVYTSTVRLNGRTVFRARRDSVSWLALIPAAELPPRLSYEEKQALLMFARRYPLLGKARADEIAALWAARLRQAENNGVPSEAEPVSPSDYLLGLARTISGIP
jgi:uncharacterized RDD family membrane protein YckC